MTVRFFNSRNSISSAASAKPKKGWRANERKERESMSAKRARKTSKRIIVRPQGDRRYMRRSKMGQFKKEVASESLAAGRRRKGIRWKGCAGGAIRMSARMGTNAAANKDTSPDRASLTLTAVALNPAPARSLWRLERRQWPDRLLFVSASINDRDYSYYVVTPGVGAGVGVSGTTTTGTYGTQGTQTGVSGQANAAASSGVAASPAATAVASPSASVATSPAASPRATTSPSAKASPGTTASRRASATPSAEAESTGERSLCP